jgi:hypothetical protein
MAEEVIRGTVEVSFPVSCHFDGEGLVAEVTGPVVEIPLGEEDNHA